MEISQRRAIVAGHFLARACQRYNSIWLENQHDEEFSAFSELYAEEGISSLRLGVTR